MVRELKKMLETTKERKVHKVIELKIHGNEDIIKTMIRSGVPDVDLCEDALLQISTDKSKKTTAQTGGSKSPWIRSQDKGDEEGDKADKDGSKGGKKDKPGKGGDTMEKGVINHENHPKGK